MTEAGWPTRPLADLTENFDSVRVPVREADRRPGPFPYYGASGVVDHVDAYLFDGEYVLVAEDGENLRTQQTPIAFMATGRFWVNNHAHILRANSRGDTRFLMYALRHVDIRPFLTGSTMPKLTQANLNRIPVPAPPLSEQRAIAHILGTLDDKIELNRRMNETLESLARAIFKSWFVDFDPVRAKMAGRKPVGMDAETAALFPDRMQDSEIGEIPTGWSVSSLGDVAEVIDCLHARKPDRKGDGKLLLQLANIRDDGLLDPSDAYLISDADYAQWVSRMEAREGDCVITNVGRVGAVAQVPPRVNAALGRNMTGIRPRAAFNSPTFLIECLLSDAMRQEVLRRVDTGTILDALNVRNIPRLRLVRPDDQVLERFETTSRPLRARMEHNLEECRTLAALRDTLLPKLLSGELRILDAEKMAEATT